jgi:GTP cyclohydrolase III
MHHRYIDNPIYNNSTTRTSFTSGTPYTTLGALVACRSAQRSRRSASDGVRNVWVEY